VKFVALIIEQTLKTVLHRHTEQLSYPYSFRA